MTRPELSISAAWAAAITILAVAVPASARAADLDRAVPGHPGLTYLDLLKQAVPDLALNPATRDVEGHLTRPLPHLAGKDYDGDPPDPVVVSYVEDERITAGGRPRIVLMADLGEPPDRAQSTTVLALYDDGPSPKLLDMVDVGIDRNTSFGSPERLKLGPGDDALVTYSEHFNSGQTYGGNLVLFVRGDRFQLIDRLMTLSDRSCGWHRDETPVISTRADPGAAYRQVEVLVYEALKHDPEDCDEPPPKPYERTYREILRWNAQTDRYETVSSDLKRLDSLNQSRF